MRLCGLVLFLILALMGVPLGAPPPPRPKNFAEGMTVIEVVARPKEDEENDFEYRDVQ